MFQERDHFAYGAARTEIVAQFVESTTKACRRFNCSKATHGIVPLFDATVILFQAIIEVFVRPMLYIAAHCLTYRSWIGRMSIRCHLLWSMAYHINGLLEKLLSCLHIPLLAQHGIHQIAILIDRPIQITPLPMHFEVGFIDVSGCPGLSTSLGSQLIRYQRGETCFPVSDGFMCERKTSRQKHLSHVTETQFVAEPPQDRKQDDVCREFKIVKGSASSFVEKMLSLWTEECCITKFRFLCSFPGARCGAMGAVH